LSSCNGYASIVHIEYESIALVSFDYGHVYEWMYAYDSVLPWAVSTESNPPVSQASLQVTSSWTAIRVHYNTIDSPWLLYIV
jgi:hypothetical protein